MASDSIKFGRSFSYPSSVSDNAASLANEDPHQTPFIHKRYSRSHSIVGSLWNYLYTRRQSAIDLVAEGRRQLQEDDDNTDRADDTECAKQDDVWMQACYNAVALVVLLVAGCICWAVYCVLEPFLHPLLWAVLIGTILYPFKKTWTERISQWLDGLEGNSIPLSAGLVLSPLFFFNYLSKLLEGAIFSYWFEMLSSVLGVASLWLLYRLSVPIHLYQGLTTVYMYLQSFDDVMTGPIQLATLVVGFVVLLVITWSQVQLKYAAALTILSTLVWFIAVLNAAAYVLGTAIALPLVTCVFVLGAALSVANMVKKMVDSGKGERLAKGPGRSCVRKGEDGVKLSHSEMGEAGSGGRSKRREDSVSDLEEVRCLGDLEYDGGGEEEGEGEGEEEEGEGEIESTDTGGESVSSLTQSDRRINLGSPQDSVTKSRVSFGAVTTISPEKIFGSLDGASEGSVEEMANGASTLQESTTKEFSQSDFIFLCLYISFFVTVFWTYPFLLILLVPFAVWSALKRVLRLRVYENTFFCRSSSIFTSLQGWIGTRKSLLLPTPIPTLINLYLTIDRKILVIAKGSIDSLISGCIIFGLLVSGLGLTVFLVLQIQVELSHYVTMMSAVWERALSSNPQLAEWMGGEGNQTMQDTFGSFATQGYMYGREWLSSQVQSAMGGEADGNSAVEKQILNLYDQLYQSYVLANTSTLDVGHTPDVEDGDLLNELQIIVMDNLETVISVLRSVWTVLSDNLSLALSLLYTVLGLLLRGGTALINTVVFLTTLFYLLCYSEDVYLPVKVVLDVLPSFSQSDTAGQYSSSFSRAIRSVFHASMSRFLFYGLYTWLVHTAFGLPVSILPAVLAAVAGAVPFIGPYWIALPAILELWLVEGEAVSAIAVLVLSLIPLFFIDSIIYGEVEGGHPYLTGLAVAGGIYFAGLEGALIGPILLCCLVFIYEVFDNATP